MNSLNNNILLPLSPNTHVHSHHIRDRIPHKSSLNPDFVSVPLVVLICPDSNVQHLHPFSLVSFRKDVSFKSGVLARICLLQLVNSITEYHLQHSPPFLTHPRWVMTSRRATSMHFITIDTSFSNHVQRKSLNKAIILVH